MVSSALQFDFPNPTGLQFSGNSGGTENPWSSTPLPSDDDGLSGLLRVMVTSSSHKKDDDVGVGLFCQGSYATKGVRLESSPEHASLSRQLTVWGAHCGLAISTNFLSTFAFEKTTDESIWETVKWLSLDVGMGLGVNHFILSDGERNHPEEASRMTELGLSSFVNWVWVGYRFKTDILEEADLASSFTYTEALAPIPGNFPDRGPFNQWRFHALSVIARW